MTSLHDILNSQGFYIYSCLKYVKALLDTLYTWVGIQLLKTNLTFLVWKKNKIQPCAHPTDLPKTGQVL